MRRIVMKRNKKRIEDLERYLFAAQRALDAPPPGPGWRESVMSEIRRLGGVEERGNGEAAFSGFAWRFAMVTGIVALILLAYIYSNGFVDYQELATRYLENPLDFII
jgi:hypothetical protein